MEKVESIENVKDINGRTIQVGDKVTFAAGGWKRGSYLKSGTVTRVFWSWRAKRFFVTVGIPRDDSWRDGPVREKKFSLFCVRRPETRIAVVSQ